MDNLGYYHFRLHGEKLYLPSLACDGLNLPGSGMKVALED